MRRSIAPLIIATTLVSTVLMAPPSTAATLPVTNANCTSFSAPRSIVGAPGDVVDISANLTGCRGVRVDKSIVSAQSDIVVTSPNAITVVDQGAAWFFDPGFGNQISRVQITLGSTLGTTSRAIVVVENAGPIETQWTVTISAGGGGGGGGSSSSPTAALPNFELSLTTSEGTACSRSSESGTVGTWLALPSANACTPPASKPNAKLLGWATSPNFPVSIAKRQVDNGWGAYETFNTNGQLTGVFIPAGGSTLVSAVGNLYAIWSE